jgi:hypothetical protein
MHLRKINIRIGFIHGKFNLFVIEILDKIDFLSKKSDFQRKILTTRCENSKFDQLLSQFLKISFSRQELNQNNSTPPAFKNKLKAITFDNSSYNC